MITAKILTDSINPMGRRITTWMLKYPRFIHSEFMTHRDFSRNAASSRAIPLKQTIQSIQNEPALPVKWGSHNPGMQSGDEITGENLTDAKLDSDYAMNRCICAAKCADSRGLHKSITNRWLEPWSHITVIATATDHRNFFALRAHPAAMPEFQVLAYRMLEEYLKSDPFHLQWGEWHIPFEDDDPSVESLTTEEKIKLATARCCWVSYNKPDKKIGEETTLEQAFHRHDESAKFGHWSPFEHCAQAQERAVVSALHSNFDTENRWSGWMQYRKLFMQERKTQVNLDEILANRPAWTIEAGL